MHHSTRTQTSNQYQAHSYFNFLSMLFVTLMLGTYVLAYKMVAVGPFIESGGIFIFPLNYALTDITTEVYGFEKTKKLIKNGLLCCFLFAMIVPLIAILPSPKDWGYHESYKYVLGNVFRFFFANTIGLIIGIVINSYLIAKWKIILNGKYFWIRSIASSSIGELITSIIADIVAFIGTTDFIGLFKLMLAIYAVKLTYALLLAWPNTLIVIHLKLKEGIKLFEQESWNFNPFLNNKNNNIYNKNIRISNAHN